MNDPLAILERLLRHGVEFVLVGGQAAILHGATLVTRDVDVCIPFTTGSLSRLETALADLHPIHRMTPQKLPFQLADFPAGSLKNLYLQTDLGILDCLGEIAGVGPYSALAPHSVRVDLPIGRCQVLSLEDMIRAKAAMDRPQDQFALRQLQAIHDRPNP